jgi:hypothetical protein
VIELSSESSFGLEIFELAKKVQYHSIVELLSVTTQNLAGSFC